MEKGNFVIENGVLVKYIGNETSISIPEDINRISMYAFEKKEIETVIIPEGVEQIESYAFFSCKKLKSVTCKQSSIMHTFSPQSAHLF